MHGAFVSGEAKVINIPAFYTTLSQRQPQTGESAFLAFLCFKALLGVCIRRK